MNKSFLYFIIILFAACSTSAIIRIPIVKQHDTRVLRYCYIKEDLSIRCKSSILSCIEEEYRARTIRHERIKTKCKAFRVERFLLHQVE